MKSAIGYVRVSTEQQAEDGVSLAAQREKIRAYAALYGFELGEIFEDAGASASTLQRPGLTAALRSLATSESVTLIVVKLDRLTRSVRDLDTLLSAYFGAGANGLVSVQEQVDSTTATGRMILNVLMSVSQWEREVIGERTSAAMQHKAANGEYTGGKVPYGYSLGEDGVSLVENPGEKEVVAAIVEYRDAGLSLRAIAKRLELAGLVNRSGRRFSASSVSNVLDRAS